MKTRILCLLLIFCILLTGCGFFGERIWEPVTFYYLCGSYSEDLCCVIVSEERETSGHTGDLPYLLALYLMGPTEDEHISPLPAGACIHSTVENGHIFLELSNIPASMTDIDFSLACACLTLTCLDIIDADDVTIRNGDQEKTMNRDSLTLYDAISENTPTEES